MNFIQALEANDKLFDFIPLPNLSHSFKGDGLVAALIGQRRLSRGLPDRRAYDRDAGASGIPAPAQPSPQRPEPAPG